MANDFQEVMDNALNEIDCQIEAYEYVAKARYNLFEAYEHMSMTFERDEIDEIVNKLVDIQYDSHYMKVAILQVIQIIKTYEGISDEERMKAYNELYAKLDKALWNDNVALKETYYDVIDVLEKPLNEIDLSKPVFESVSPEEIEMNLE